MRGTVLPAAEGCAPIEVLSVGKMGIRILRLAGYCHKSPPPDPREPWTVRVDLCIEINTQPSDGDEP